MAFFMWVNFNGDIVKDDKPLIRASNRSFRYGDALFETMKLEDGAIKLFPLHWERLETGLKLLKMKSRVEAADMLRRAVQLAELNRCTALAKVRLMIFRDQPDTSCYLLEAEPLPPAVNEFNEEGLRLHLYADARRACDAIANMKTANFLPYTLAALDAAEKGVHDCIVLNNFSRICDTSRANIFLLKNTELYTPALSEGCIAGVMRRYLIDQLKLSGHVVHQQAISEAQLLDADEVFLTNAVFGLRWVAQYKEATFGKAFSQKIYNSIIKS